MMSKYRSPAFEHLEAVSLCRHVRVLLPNQVELALVRRNLDTAATLPATGVAQRFHRLERGGRAAAEVGERVGAVPGTDVPDGARRQPRRPGPCAAWCTGGRVAGGGGNETAGGQTFGNTDTTRRSHSCHHVSHPCFKQCGRQRRTRSSASHTIATAGVTGTIIAPAPGLQPGQRQRKVAHRRRPSPGS